MSRSSAAPLLSIIIPFHDSWHKSQRLLATLQNIRDSDVEVILVDDGSTDQTARHLAEYAKTVPCHAKVIRHENRGPGGARNSGIKVARGDFLWFVDCDDDISVDAISLIREKRGERFDFIDFNYVSQAGVLNSLELPEGFFSVIAGNRTEYFSRFGRIFTKIFRKQFILRNHLFYPEHCLYEDNQLLFLYPFALRRFYKSVIVGYFHHEDFASVTRTGGRLPPRFYDRMLTARQGFSLAIERGPTAADRAGLEALFTQLYLLNTVVLSRFPGKSWLQGLRVMRAFRDERRAFQIRQAPSVRGKGSRLFQLAWKTLWLISALLPPQRAYFARLRRAAWPGNH